MIDSVQPDLDRLTKMAFDDGESFVVTAIISTMGLLISIVALIAGWPLGLGHPMSIR
jgi:hypothetical protein